MTEIVLAQDAYKVSTVRAKSDDALINLWLRQKRSEHTRNTYKVSINLFTAFINSRPLASLSVEDMVEYREYLEDKYKSKSTQAIRMKAIKSLLTFGQKTGYLQFNIGSAVDAPAPSNTLAQRILTEEEALRLVYAPKRLRDKVLLRLLYASGGRVSEISELRWADVKVNGDSGQITVTGKGEKTRAILLKPETYKQLLSLKPEDASNDDYVFLSQYTKKREGDAIEAGKNNLDASAIFRIVKKAGESIGIGGVSPHWLRHSHASHALDRGASLVVVKETLGHSNISVTNKYLHAKPNDSSALHLAV